MARTRASKPAPAADKPTASADSTSRYTLPPPAADPPMIFILPRAATPEAKIVTLPNPRYSKPTRYLACPETGLYEFTKVAAPKSAPRSWLIETIHNDDSDEEKRRVDGAVSKSGDMYVATAIDPLFIVLPSLLAKPAKAGAQKLFISSEDHFDKLPEDASHLSEVLQMDKVRRIFETRMKCVCDTVEVGDETMFRMNEEKLFKEILAKARRFAEGSLPRSMEEKFVTKALEAPILSRRRQDAEGTAAPAGTDVLTPSTESGESQASTATDTTSTSLASEAPTAATSIPETETPIEEVKSAMQASEEVLSLQRLRVAFDFICASYLAPATNPALKKQLSDKTLSTVDFSPLDDYTAQLAKLRADAMAARSAGDFSRKHPRDEDQDAAREEKKRKVEEEKKKKALESRGVRELKKVNTTGMRKLSDFFKKK